MVFELFVYGFVILCMSLNDCVIVCMIVYDFVWSYYVLLNEFVIFVCDFVWMCMICLSIYNCALFYEFCNMCVCFVSYELLSVSMISYDFWIVFVKFTLLCVRFVYGVVWLCMFLYFCSILYYCVWLYLIVYDFELWLYDWCMTYYVVVWIGTILYCCVSWLFIFISIVYDLRWVRTFCVCVVYNCVWFCCFV